MLMIVLLKLALIWAWPCEMFLRSRRLTRFAPCCFATSYQLLLRDLLLTGNGNATTFAGPGIGVSALAAHRQPAPVADPLVAADLDLPLYVLLNLTTEVALHLEFRLDVTTDPGHLVVGELPD